MIGIDTLDWDKGDGLLPAIVQDRQGRVRMLGYMNRDAFEATIASGFVTFFSRSRQQLWLKGETSGNRLALIGMHADCDRDALLVIAEPEGPTCHTGTTSCFGTEAPFFPTGLQDIVRQRSGADPVESYVARLRAEGIRRVAQKVGEEGVELSLAAVGGDRAEMIGEAADLAFHMTLLLECRGISWNDVSAELERRHRERAATASS